jgi:hypothetical protein
MKGNLPEDYSNSYLTLMLRTLLDDYFSGITDERDFDFPLISLLRAMGYYDIHFTHGDREIGKDFIAKKTEEGVEYQYAFQSKKGDVNQAKCTNEVLPQLRLATLSGQPHPQFNKNLPRRVVLVLTGRPVGNAGYLLDDFNDTLQNEYQKEKVILWGKDQLIPFFEDYGLSSIHQLTAQGLSGFAQFYLIYGKALDGKLSDREIEEFSRLWLDPTLDYGKRVLRAAIETELIAVKLIGNGLLYEAITTYLALTRVVMDAMYETEDQFLVEVYRQIISENILPLCKEFRTEVSEQWAIAGSKLLVLVGEASNTMPMLHYIVWCARILEINSLYFFLTDDAEEKESVSEFLSDFIENEPGCGHIPGERYAISVVWTVLGLLASQKRDEAVDFVKRNLVWVCDRMEQGFGLPRYDADEYEETATLLGYAFSFIKVQKDHSSFVATALGDLAAFLNDKELYSTVVNDVEACDISYTYWQFPDTKAIFTIYSKESRTYPNIPHRPTLNEWKDFDYAEHIKHEPDAFRITEKTGLAGLVLLSVLLKDRYFPKMWSQIVSAPLSSKANRAT